jgi:hypothetical protein
MVRAQPEMAPTLEELARIADWPDLLAANDVVSRLTHEGLPLGGVASP